MAITLEQRGDGRGLMTGPARAEVLAAVRGALESTARHTLDSAGVTRRDSLWTADPRVLLTNPLSVAYGACGPMLLLNRVGPLPEVLVKWLLTQPLSVRSYLPGLYLGLAGIALFLLNLYAATGDAHFAELAVRGLDFDFAAGMVLCDALVPVSYLALNPPALPFVLAELTSLGLPPQVRDVISALRQGSPGEASAILARWQV
ncbi:hypothetical protein ACIBHX_39555 [Nonomuraea sp. NPDC050536]|uniref:hypothetical protein n=1 Tax=Nonomuraea sp. NPDC050536 TaxID=3364366 RepID=UPI0037C53BE5